MDSDVARLLIKISRDPKELERQLANFLNEAMIDIEMQKQELQLLRKYRDGLDQLKAAQLKRQGAEVK